MRDLSVRVSRHRNTLALLPLIPPSCLICNIIFPPLSSAGWGWFSWLKILDPQLLLRVHREILPPLHLQEKQIFALQLQEKQIFRFATLLQLQEKQNFDLQLETCGEGNSTAKRGSSSRTSKVYLQH